MHGTSINGTIRDLKEQGMKGCDSAMITLLRRETSIRIRGYADFLARNSSTNPIKPYHNFSFDDVVRIHDADEIFQLKVNYALGVIERRLRATWSRYIEKNYGPNGYQKNYIYKDREVNNKTQHQLQKLMAIANKASDRAAAKRGLRKGQSTSKWPHIATQRLTENLTMGQLSIFIGAMKADILEEYEKELNFGPGMDGALRHLTDIRNKCAHYERLLDWNGKYDLLEDCSLDEKLRKSFSRHKTGRKKIFNTLVLLAYMMEIIRPEVKWKEDIIEFIVTGEFSDKTKLMGFPENWRYLAVWK